MNHNRMTLAIIAVVAAAALATIAFALPQQVMAGGHKHHHNNNSHTKVEQQANQQNQCSGKTPETTVWLESTPQSGTVCINEGSNNATITH